MLNSHVPPIIRTTPTTREDESRTILRPIWEFPNTMPSHSSTEATSTPAALKVSIEYASRIEIWWYPTYHRIKALGIFGSTI